MVKTKVCKGDKVVIIRGAGRAAVDAGNNPVVCSVIKVDRQKGYALLEMPRPKAKRGQRDEPMLGVELWKTVRYNPQSGEAGGLKLIKKPVHVSNLKIVEKGPSWEGRR